MFTFSPKPFRWLLRSFLAIALAVVILGLSMVVVQAQNNDGDGNGTAQPSGSPVVLQEQPLFYVEARVGSFSPAFRARVISERLEDFAKTDAALDSLAIVTNDQTQTTDIQSGEDVLVTITAADAQAADQTERQLAEDYLEVIQPAIASFRQSYSLRNILLGILYTVLLTIVFFVSFVFSNRWISRFNERVKASSGERIRGLRLFGTEMISASRVADFITEITKLTRLTIFFLLLGLYINLVLSFFPWTKGLANQLFSYVQTAALSLWQGLVAYLPNLFFLGLIIFITSYTLKLLKFTFAEIRRGDITIPGFYPEWAKPTYNIVRFGVLAFAATIAFPYLPGAGTPAFQGISLFLGVIFSLGSSGAVANFVSGVILTYSRPFVVGDRVKISETMGDVIEKSLLVTRVNTPKNVIVTIPNAMVLSCHIINYSNSIRNEKTPPLILHTTITLGYDVPWQKVHQVLMDAASEIDNILQDPAPFVLQTSLDDFYVSYELNVYTDIASRMAKIYSDLHQKLQDKCNEADIEILSPHYSAVRDGHHLAVPEEYLPQNYTPPAFRVSPLGNIFNPGSITVSTGNDAKSPPADP